MRRFFPVFSLALLATACKVGPDYHEPNTPMPSSFVEEKAKETISICDEDLVQWWTALNDPFLNDLLEEALANNFDYRIALERIYQARSQYWIQFTQLLPDFEYAGEAARSRFSQSFPNAFGLNTATATPAVPPAGVTPTNVSTTLSPYQNFFQIGFDAVWEIDVFGGLRRASDASYDIWEASIEDARNIKLIILSEVANTYVTIRANQIRQETAAAIVRSDENLVELLQSKFEAGLANEQSVLTARASLERDKSNEKALKILVNQAIYSLAVLLGRWPESLICDFQDVHPIPYAKGIIPCTLPSDLLRRRPDIRSAERQLASATEQIGVAVSDLFPRFSLVGSSASFASNPLQGANIGLSSSSLSKLITHPSLVWGIGGLVTGPIFDFGRRLSQVDVQKFLRNQAFLNYQKTVIVALQETEQALTAYFNEEERLNDLTREVQSNRQALDLTADLFQAGLADYTQVIEAREIWLSSIADAAGSQQNLSSDLIAVYKAIGGDW